MNEMSDAWSRLMTLPAYRVAIVCARIGAIGFLVLWVGLVVGVVAACLVARSWCSGWRLWRSQSLVG